MVYTHVLNRAGGRGVRSPADALFGPAVTAAAGFRQLDSQPNLLVPGAPASRRSWRVRTMRKIWQARTRKIRQRKMLRLLISVGQSKYMLGDAGEKSGWT